MKKFFYSAVAMLMMAATQAVFTSCGSEDNEIPEPPTTPKAVKATLTETLTVNAELMDIFNIEVTCVDANEKETTKTLEQTTLTNSFSSALPASTDMKLRFTLKQQPTERFNINVQVISYAETFDAKGNFVRKRTGGNSLNMNGYDPSRIENIMERLNDQFASSPISVDDEGDIFFEL